jgi:hypothetical protein
MHNQQNNQQLNEGLRPLDLKEMVHPTFDIDVHRSKMGEDKDVCVLSFQVKDRAPAKDMMEFIEKGYHFVLDSDISSGENEDGEYSVFVELSRSPRLAEQIKDITYGVRKLTGIDDFKFKYYKQPELHNVNEETLASVVPSTAVAYENAMNRVRTEGVKKFFSKTLMDDLTLDGDIITIHKPFNSQIQLRMVKEGEADTILEGSIDTITMDEASMSEIFWLTKVLGDYNINKVGENFVFDNKGQAMILQRM